MPLLAPYASSRAAAAAAAGRRQSLVQHLKDVSTEGLVVARFLEAPDRGRFPTDGAIVRGATAAAEMARLRWQLASDERLLLERATDVLEDHLRTTSAKFDAGSITVSLESIPWTVRRQWTYPWRVVIRAPSHLSLHGAFAKLSDWLGIAVYQRPSSRFVAFNRCTSGLGGLEGVVGGIFRQTTSPSEVFAVTCRHVISDHCGSLRHPAGPVQQPDCPDAVLLNPNADCFDHPGASAADVYAARGTDTATYQLARLPLVKCHPQRPRTRGWLKYTVGATTHTGEFVRFPHHSVRSFRYRVGLLRWPPISRGFAQPGDSGVWVLEEGKRIWLGMVVCGYDDDLDTLVADGEALLDYFSTLMNGSASPPVARSISPLTWP